MRMDPGPGREQEGEVGVGGNEENDDADNAKEKNAARSFVSFSLETKTKEPWPPLISLGNVMLDPNPHQLYCANN